MIERLTEERPWEQYKALLPRDIGKDGPKIPLGFKFSLRLNCGFDYVPPHFFISSLREWLTETGATHVYYFLTEVTDDDHDHGTDFRIPVTELTSDALSDINPSAESVLVGQQHDWALFVDHEGIVHAAGPRDLICQLLMVCAA